MTSLRPSPVLIALVQTATSLPVFFLGLPAGVIADLVERRRLLIVTQTWMLAAAAVLGFTTLAGKTTPALLLGLTAALGIGSALNAPAWQAIVPELVPREDLPAAIAINSVGFNVARAIGPALAGVLVSVFNPAVNFLFNAVSFVGVIWVLLKWKRRPVDTLAATERAMAALRAGFRYVFNSPRLQAVLIRTALFVAGASALWALLPVLARFELGGSSAVYGLLLGCLGTGSICGAFLLPRVRARFTMDQQVIGATAMFAVVLVMIAFLHVLVAVCFTLLLAGMSWMISMSTLNTTVQTVVPEWIRARALAFYLLVFQGTMAIGAYIWGAISERFSIRWALSAAGAGLILSVAAGLRFRLVSGLGTDFSYVNDPWQPPIAPDLELGAGPVMVTVEYEVDPERASEFVETMQRVRRMRKRDGAMQWMLFQDTAAPERWNEMFLVDSWEEHMRQHVRATIADRAISARARAFHRSEYPPRVTHWIARRPKTKRDNAIGPAGTTEL